MSNPQPQPEVHLEPEVDLRPRLRSADRHFHSTNDVVYVSHREPHGELKLRVYLVNPGGVLEEFDMTKAF